MDTVDNISDFWDSMEILSTREQHVKELEKFDTLIPEVYNTLASHLKKISQVHPSSIEDLQQLFENYDNLNTKLDRLLLNLYIYVNYIRVKHLDCSLQIQHQDKIGQLLTMLQEQRRSLTSYDYTEYLDLLNNQKDKQSEIYHPYLVLLEKRTIKHLLGGLMGMKMILKFVINHLSKSTDILDSLDIKLQPNSYSLYM